MSLEGKIPVPLSMKNILVYYFSLLTPLFLLMYSWEMLDPSLALNLLGGYVLLYRTWLDGNRLFKKGLISRSDIWKVSFNGARIHNFKALYLQK